MATESTGGEEAQPAMTHTDKTQLAITSVREKKMDMAFLGKELFAGEGKKGNGASAPLAEEMVATSADLLPKASKVVRRYTQSIAFRYRASIAASDG